jgi:predicted RNA-binding Zn-ribbon protein involved in translation (DUF1610 family)
MDNIDIEKAKEFIEKNKVIQECIDLKICPVCGEKLIWGEKRARKIGDTFGSHLKCIKCDFKKIIDYEIAESWMCRVGNG